VPVHVALLRGINVGGHHKIAMADLRQLFVGLGFADVSSYIPVSYTHLHAGSKPPSAQMTIPKHAEPRRKTSDSSPTV